MTPCFVFKDPSPTLYLDKYFEVDPACSQVHIIRDINNGGINKFITPNQYKIYVNIVVMTRSTHNISLLQHCNQAIHQCTIWSKSFQSMQNAPSPDNFGWIKDENVWKPVCMDTFTRGS